jgi:hypothetical protein
MKFKKSKNRKTKEERCVWAPKRKTRERKKPAARTGLDKKKENKNLGKRKERRTPGRRVQKNSLQYYFKSRECVYNPHSFSGMMVGTLWSRYDFQPPVNTSPASDLSSRQIGIQYGGWIYHRSSVAELTRPGMANG